MLFKKEEKQDHQATVVYYPPNVHIAFQAFRVARKRVYLTSNKERLLNFRHAVDGICEQKRLALEGSTKERLQIRKKKQICEENKIRQDVFFRNSEVSELAP